MRTLMRDECVNEVDERTIILCVVFSRENQRVFVIKTTLPWDPDLGTKREILQELPANSYTVLSMVNDFAMNMDAIEDEENNR